MLSINFANITNAKMIGKLLPWWARGRKTSLLLQALLHPIISVHNTFKVWALEKLIECHITSQKMSLEWYLKYKLSRHFYNDDDEFLITQGEPDNRPSDMEPSVDSDINNSCYGSGLWYNDKYWSNTGVWRNNEQAEDVVKIVANQIYVFAPAIVDTIEYNHDDYERDIRNIMSKYMINFNKINIIVYDTIKT